MVEQTSYNTRNSTDTVENELQLLEALESTPETTQADLAAQVGVAVGTVNWYLKRWSKKGYVKIKRIGRWEWHYLLTPQGMARKATLASKYLEASMSLYRRTRTEAKTYLGQVQAAGYNQVIIDDDSEIADICRLTCIELGMDIIEPQASDSHIPRFQVDGFNLKLIWPEDSISDNELVEQFA